MSLLLVGLASDVKEIKKDLKKQETISFCYMVYGDL